MDASEEGSVPAKVGGVVIRRLNFRTEGMIADEAISGRSSFKKYYPVACEVASCLTIPNLVRSVGV
jgi:hypothetical protein